MDWNYLKERLLSVAEDLMWAIIVLVIGHFLIRFICKRLPKSKLFKKLEPSARSFITSTIQMVLYVMLVIVVISILGIPAASIIGVLTSACLAIGLALQGALSNFAGGIMLLLFKPFRAGDYITCSGGTGTVKDISVFYTSIITDDNKKVTVPNGVLMNDSIINFSAEELRRVDIPFSVAYGTDDKVVTEGMLKILEGDERALSEPQPLVRVTGCTDNSVAYSLRVWCRSEVYWDMYFDLMKKVSETINEMGIKVPVSHMEIHVSGDSGKSE